MAAAKAEQHKRKRKKGGGGGSTAQEPQHKGHTPRGVVLEGAVEARQNCFRADSLFSLWHSGAGRASTRRNSKCGFHWQVIHGSSVTRRQNWKCTHICTHAHTCTHTHTHAHTHTHLIVNAEELRVHAPANVCDGVQMRVLVLVGLKSRLPLHFTVRRSEPIGQCAQHLFVALHLRRQGRQGRCCCLLRLLLSLLALLLLVCLSVSKRDARRRTRRKTLAIINNNNNENNNSN